MAFSTLCLNFLLWSFLIHQVVFSRSYDRFEVDLISFSNPKNMTTSGKCCDGNKDGLSCPDACDTFFVVCIHFKYSKYPNCILKGSSGIVVRGSEFHSPINSSQSNPPSLVSITNIDDWKADFSLTVAFLDDDTPPGRTFNGSLSTSKLILKYNHVLPITSGDDWSQRNYSKSGISFELRYRLKCGKNLYGSNCGVHCTPKDNRFGHTSCLPNGTKVCLPGYEGQKCDKARCSSGCGEYGDCVVPEKCNCHEGWTGPNCSQCVTLYNCLHGTCVKPHQCNCKINWTGQHCNVYNRYCPSYHPCKNNGKCINDAARNFTCSCYNGFHGVRCEKFSCSPACNLTNANCVTGVGCSCYPGWQGPNCNQCMKNSTCINGYCTRPFECICNNGWNGTSCNISKNAACLATCNQTRGFCNENSCSCYSGWQGPNCNECVKNLTCINGYCTKPFECICNNGWTGTSCNISKNAACLATCNRTRGFCNENDCSCYSGWQGPNCNQCMKNSTCINGYCTKPFECICNNGWTGTSCNISKNATCFATCNQTRGFCNKKYGCSCYSGWQGPNCNQCMKNSTCINGYCTKPFECICNNGWTGTSCNISKNATCFATCNQTRGFCNEKYVCSCYSGWQGPNCNQCVKNSTCINGYCTKPFECICNNGWTGTSCNISKNAACLATCNRTRGFCNENDCSCYSGWQGPNCNQCVKNSTCINGYCTKPFECICNNGWTGTSCNINKNATCFATCNQTRGFCNEKYRCSCYSGWQGPNCSHCIKNSTCINGYCTKPFECICNGGWTGESCSISTKTTCFATCNQTRGFCNEKNFCSCYPGWQGPNCNQCMKNSTCINGYCTKPFECICNDGWAGAACNISTKKKNLEQQGSASSNDFRTVAIAVPFGVLVCIILLFASYYVWRSFHRRATFCVTSPEAFVNNAMKFSYNKRDDAKTIRNLNNNIGGLSDLAKLPSTEIAMNSMATSGANGQNGTPPGSTSSSDSGYDEEATLPNAVSY